MSEPGGDLGVTSQGIGGEIRVLHVDDDRGVAEVVARVLERESDRITVVTETGAAGAMERLATESVDCVVSDYEMDGQDGLALLRSVRDRRQGMPFILFTGKGSEEIASEAISAGVTDYLQKGGGDQYAVLANRIENAVARHRTQRRLERRVRQQETVAQLGRLALGSSSLSAFLRDAARVVTDALGTEVTAVLEHRPERGDLLLRASAGLPESWVGTRTWSDTPDTQLGYALTVTEPVAFEGLDDEESVALLGSLPDRGVTGGVSVVVGDPSEPWGVLCSYSTTGRAFDAEDCTFVETVANLLATAVDRAEHERRLSTLISNLPGMVYRCDNAPTWPMEFVGGQVQALTGYTADELESDEVAWGEEIIVKEDRERVWETVQAALATDEPFEITYGIQTRSGERKWVWEQGRGVYSADGELAALEGFITDITDRREYERRLEAERDRLDDFARVVSHDLRSPLEAAIGHTELLAAAEGENDHVEGLRDQLTRMQELIEDVLALARQDATVARTEPVDLERVAGSAWGTIATGDATLEVADPGTVVADRSRLQQLLENLFLNAVEHGSRDGSTAADDGAPDAVVVRVGRIEAADGPVGFYVADDGPGIPEDEREKVFESGYSTADGGTGLGLSIVERIASAHGWEVSLAPTDGDGARFEVTGVSFA